MGWIKAMGYLSLILSAIGLGWLVSVNNSGLVKVDVVIWQSPEVTLGLILMVTLFVGCLMGILVNGLLLWRFKRQRNKLRKQLDSALQRFEQLQ
ncbi:MAG: LapA family protein [Bermanella sp.]